MKSLLFYFESRVAGGLAALVGCVLLTSCASGLPEGSRQLAEVVHVGTRDEIVEHPAYEAILAAGMADEEITDGSAVVVKFYCCGGSIEETTAAVVFVPPSIGVEEGDFVEIRHGRSPTNTDPGRLPTVTQIRKKRDEDKYKANCYWDPPDPNLWMRVIYCDWMPEEGWEYRSGLSNTWFKSARAPSMVRQ